MKLEKIPDRIVFSDSTFTKRTVFNEEKMLSFVLNLKSGQELPPHKHEDSGLILYVMTGTGEVTVNGNTSKVTVGDAVYCEGEETFSLKNSGIDNMSCFVVLAPRPSLKAYANEVGKA